MNTNLFQELSNEYVCNNTSSDKHISEIYSKFRFFYMNYREKSDEFLQYANDILKEFKLIVFSFIPIDSDQQDEDYDSNDVNSILCVENQCFIITFINMRLLLSILKKTNSHLINVSTQIENLALTTEDKLAIDEVNSFYSYTWQNINSKFVKSTLDPVFSFIIRRHFFESKIFTNKNFFSFYQYFNNENENEIDLFSLSSQEIKKQIESTKSEIQTVRFFNDDDFIVLRSMIHSNRSSYISFAVFKENNYPFIIKKYYKIDKLFEREYEFCKNYAHYCLTHFYGFLIDNDGNVDGFVYQFMSNDTLTNFVEQNPDKIDVLFILKTIFRVFQGVNFLHSNNLIHRDIRPDNILIDHNFNQYLSDFDRIRNAVLKEGEKMTGDIGSMTYAPPEQLNDESKVSFKSDIFSFGKLIYFLYEKKHMTEDENEEIEMKNAPIEVQNLIKKCINKDVEKRPSLDEIKSVIFILFGKLYLNGKLVKQDYKKAKDFFTFSSELKNFDAIVYLGRLYLEGNGVNKDYKEAKRYFNIAEKYNNPSAFFELGRLYDYGFGVDIDLIKAREYYEKAADLDHSEACNSLGFIYFSGEGYGIEKDLKKSISYLTKAMKLNNETSYNNIGYLYYIGQGFERDYEKARYYFEISAKFDSQIAYYNLGNIYYYAHGVTQDYPRAMHYFKLAADQMHSDAMIYIGKMYLKGLGVDKDINKAKEYFELSAQQNNSRASLYLGKLHLYDIDSDTKYQKAIECFIKSGLKNNSKSILNLGKMYFQGTGIKQNYKKAFEYFNLSAEKENLTAHYYLCLMFENKKGCEKDLSKAISHYEKCSNVHNSNIAFNYDDNHCRFEKNKINKSQYIACNTLGLIYILEKKFFDKEKALFYIKIAGSNEYGFGQNSFGLFRQYYDKNPENAKYFFQKAAKNSNFMLAEFNLGRLFELENNENEAMSHYISAIDKYFMPFIFKNQMIDDERLEMSKTFVFCFIGLKISLFYLSPENNNDEMSKKFFLMAVFALLFKLISHQECFKYSFAIQKDDENNLLNFVLNFPLFKLFSKKDKKHSSLNGWKKQESDQKSLFISFIKNVNNDILQNYQIRDEFVVEDKLRVSNDLDENQTTKIFDEIIQKFNCQNKFKIAINYDKNEIQLTSNDTIEGAIEYPNNINKILFGNMNKLKIQIITVVDKMSKILFEPPYSILFGRIKIRIENKKTEFNNIDESFYEGFGIQ